MESLLSVSQVAELVQLSEYTVRQAIRAGELPATKLRGRIRIAPTDVATWIDAGRIPSPLQSLEVPSGGYRELARPRRVVKPGEALARVREARRRAGKGA